MSIGNPVAPLATTAVPAELRDMLRSALAPGSRGIEVGPGRGPVAPKRAGYRTLVVDVADADELRRTARALGAEAAEIGNIEAVDVVGDASRLRELLETCGHVERFDWIVSSHNFEHLADPVGFLCDCEALLSPGGLVGLIIPDKRYTFDRFQRPSQLADLLRARREAGTGTHEAWAAFGRQALDAARVDADGNERRWWVARDNAPEYLRARDIRRPYTRLQQILTAAAPPAFHGHRWHFSPAALELLLFDLNVLGICGLAPEPVVVSPLGWEFAVLLRAGGVVDCPPEECIARRSALCRQIEDEAAAVTGHCLRLERELADARAELDALRVALDRRSEGARDTGQTA